MDEKKKLFIGIGVAVLTAIILSWFISFSYSGKKGKETIDFLGTTSNKEYKLDVIERKIAKEYVPLDMTDIKKKTGIKKDKVKKEENKIVEIKDDKGKIIATKEYKEDNVVVITNFEGKNKVSTETTKEKNGKYEGKAVCFYPNGTKNTYVYKKGVKHGKAEIEYSNGDKEIFEYVKGVPEGEAIYYYTNGDKEIYKYVNGIEGDEKEYIFKDGRVEHYSNNQKK